MSGFSIQRYRYKAIPNPPTPVCHKPTNWTTVKTSQEFCPKILLIGMFENRLDSEKTVKIRRDIRRTTWNDSMIIFACKVITLEMETFYCIFTFNS